MDGQQPHAHDDAQDADEDVEMGFGGDLEAIAARLGVSPSINPHPRSAENLARQWGLHLPATPPTAQELANWRPATQVEPNTSVDELADRWGLAAPPAIPTAEELARWRPRVSTSRLSFNAPPRRPAGSSPPPPSSSDAPLPPSSLVTASSQIPAVQTHKGALYLQVAWTNWLIAEYLPNDMRDRAPEQVRFTPSPHTVDVPLIAPSSETPVQSGNGLQRIWGEGSDRVDPDARRMMREFCRFNATLLLARIRLSIRRGEDQSRWRRRIRSSIRVATIEKVFPGIPRHLLAKNIDLETRKDSIVDYILAQGASYDADALIRRLRAINAHPSLLRYLERRFVPSLPNLHFQAKAIKGQPNELRIDGVPVDRETARQHLLDRLDILRSRLSHQPSRRLCIGVILGTWTEWMITWLVHVITSEQAERPIGTTTHQVGLSGSAQAGSLWGWSRLSREDLDEALTMPASRFHDEEGKEATRAVRAVGASRANFNVLGAPYSRISRRRYIRHRATEARKRLRKANAVRKKKGLPLFRIPTIDELWHTFSNALARTQDRCSLCGCRLTFYGRQKQDRRRVWQRRSNSVSTHLSIEEESGDAASPPPASQQQQQDDAASPPPASQQQQQDDAASPPPASQQQQQDDAASPPPASQQQQQDDAASPPPASQQQQGNSLLSPRASRSQQRDSGASLPPASSQQRGAAPSPPASQQQHDVAYSSDEEDEGARSDSGAGSSVDLRDGTWLDADEDGDDDESNDGERVAAASSARNLGPRLGRNWLYQKEPWEICAHNFSPDRRDPCLDYSAENVDPMCGPCNFIKKRMHLNQARLVVHHHAVSWQEQGGVPRTRPADDGRDGERLLDAEMGAPPSPMLPDEEQAIRRLVHRRFTRMVWQRDRNLARGSTHPRDVAFTLSEAQLYNLFLSRRVGRGLFLSADGSVWPMPMASVDRLRSTDGYGEKTVRLTTWGMNATKKQAGHDEPWVDHQEAIDVPFVEAQAAAVEGFALPYVDWIDRVIEDDASDGLVSDSDSAFDLSDSGDELAAAYGYFDETDEDDFRDQDDIIDQGGAAKVGPPTRRGRKRPGSPSNGGRDGGYGHRRRRLASPSRSPSPPAGDMRHRAGNPIPLRLAQPRLAMASRVERVSTTQHVNVTKGVMGFGNCQFNAIAALTDWEAAALRREVVRRLRDPHWRERLRPVIPNDVVYRYWVDEMEMDGTWGDENTLLVIREILGRRIVVVSDPPSGRYAWWPRASDENDDDGEDVIGLWLFGRHYEGMF